MSEATPSVFDAARRYESRAIFLTGAAYVVAVSAIEPATLAKPLDATALALYVLLSSALAARYILWSRLPFHAPVRAVLPWALVGTGLVVALAVVLRDPATLFFYLAAVEGSLAVIRPRWVVAWVAGIIAVSLAIALSLQGWEAGGLTVLASLPVYLMLAVAAALLLRQEDQRAQVERLLAELSQAHRRLEYYASQVEALTVAEERTRLAREIHDTLGHTLTALDVQLELLRRLPDDRGEERREAGERGRALVKEGLRDLRRVVRALRPDALETFSLPEAIADLIARFRDTIRIETVWRIEGETVPLPPFLGVPLYRAAQEALTNVSRHAAASRVTVMLRFTPGAVTLRVEDDGRGGEATPGFGLRGMRERAEALGGKFHAGPAAEEGFRVEMTLPR